MRGADAFEGAANLVGDRFAYAFGGIAGLTGTAAEAVGGGELFGETLDFMPGARRLSEIARRGGRFELLAGFRQPFFVLRRGARIEQRSEVAFNAKGIGAATRAVMPRVRRRCWKRRWGGR